jgi:UDP-3-O-[3-hydroxymyristoyl] glucosamine N-acyltransferase
LTSSNSTAGFTLADLAARVGAELVGDPDVVITRGAPIDKAGTGDISFVANKNYLRFIATTKASALVLDPTVECAHIPTLRHKNPYLAFARIIDALYPVVRRVPPGVHKTAATEPDSAVDPTAGIGPLCYVGAASTVGPNTQLISSVHVGNNVTVGSNCLFYPGVRIMDNCRIGNNVILQPGVVIGSDGFGYAESEAGPKKIQQVGWVEIEDDVEIGANTTVDRGALGATKIGRGSKIDNLVQIAHNVEIGQFCIIVSQVGISGSTKLGNGVVLAGQVGLIGHLELGDRVVVGAQSGVTKSYPAGTTIFGSPAREIMEAKRIEASIRRLPELLKRVKKIENDLAE